MLPVNRINLVKFTLNGKVYTARSDEFPINTSLKTFIRNHAQLRGTKYMCLEGSCGACTVQILGKHSVTNELRTWSANSCLMPIFSCHDLDITTIEGIGDRNTYDKTQTRLVIMNGTQCGYCTPGMIMNMHSLMDSKDGKVTKAVVEKSFGGNLCRCTGYRPILDAFKSLSVDGDQKIESMCTDIEDIKLCTKSGIKCAPVLKIKLSSFIQDEVPIEIIGTQYKQEWHRVYSIAEVFSILKRIDDKPYMLVAGNTAHGLYRRHPSLQIFIDVTRVRELRSFALEPELELGGNVTITEMIEIFESAAKAQVEFQYLFEVNKHLEEVGSLQIRNSGTIAGNLMIKHKHPEFTSDIFLLLNAIGAVLTIAEDGDQFTELDIDHFIGSNMDKKIIFKITIPPRPPRTFVFRSYKIMPRTQNAPTLLSAAFLVEFTEKKKFVISARIGYAGVKANFYRALQTELHLIGKNLYNATTLASTLKILGTEISVNQQSYLISPEYLTKVAQSLFYKFMLNTNPIVIMKSFYRSGGTKLERGISTGKQVFQTIQQNYPITMPIHRVEAFSQAGGEALYTNDYPKLTGELWAAVVQARTVHGKIFTFDPSEALKLPGVKYFFSALDIPGVNSFTNRNFNNYKPEEIFCSDRVLYSGQPAGMILADSMELAHHAANLVNIIYEVDVPNQVLPTIQDVLKSNESADRVKDSVFNMVAKEYGSKKEYKIIGKYESGSQYHFTMEPQTCVAIPAEDGLNVYSATQWVTFTQAAISQALRIPENAVNIHVKRLGGGFGAKLTRANFAACVASLGCYLTNRPVRFVMNIESNMEVIGKRHACVAEYTVDVDRNGKIQKLFHQYYSDNGCSSNDFVTFGIPGFFSNCYDTSTWDVLSYTVHTDAPSSTFTRAPAATEGIAMIENIMEHIAYEIGKDPVSVRLQNLAEGNPIRKKILQFVTSVEYERRKKEIKNFNTKNRWLKRGLAVTIMDSNHYFFGHFPAYVTIYHLDGSVAISHGGIEMGQGINTKVTQVAARALGIPVQLISVKEANNLIGSNSEASGASLPSDSICVAVLKACEKLNDRIKPIREEFPGAPWNEITMICNQRNINLSEFHMQSPSETESYNITGFSCAEVEADMLTGKFILKRVDILEDVGESISPWIDVGQIEGAFVMGLGLWLTEKIVYDRDGKLLTNRPWMYHPPGANDIPVDFRVSFFKNATNEKSVLRSKATGEPPLCLSVVALFALRNAVMSARRDAGLQYIWHNFKAPCTVENVFMAAGTDPGHFRL